MDVVEEFFGCYLLYSLNPKYKGRTYIGFTVDPQRRLKQHNAGCQAGGARRTSNRGPWAMILLIQGFPNTISALRFEWAWQHPQRSRRLNHVPPKKNKERALDYNLRLVAEMLRTGPWNRLPLTIRWLRPDLELKNCQFPIDKDPPLHMPIVYGPVKSKKLLKETMEKKDESDFICGICFADVNNTDAVNCLSPKCSTASHLTCLADHFLATSEEEGKILPVHGKCPVCDLDTLWGDIIRKKKGCYSYLDRDNEET